LHVRNRRYETGFQYLSQAIARFTQSRLVPRSTMAGYSGTPLPQKLGIKANAIVTVINAPENYARLLGKLPENVQFRTQMSNKADFVHFFMTSRRELEKQLKSLRKKKCRSRHCLGFLAEKISGHSD
jgi:hypothetical protein